jgi:hypothetical protein
MLFGAHLSDLEAYIKASEDPELIKWWAQYCESNARYDEAIRVCFFPSFEIAWLFVQCQKRNRKKQNNGKKLIR